MIHPSTFSIVAYDSQEQAWGIAVASKFPAVGAVVPWAKAGAGAVATQSYANTSFGPNGLRMMADGLSAEETLARLLAEDPDRENRQVGLVDAQGRPATFTGARCNDWAGGVTGASFAAQGNILTGENVIQAMAGAFRSTEGSLARCLYAALLAGDRAGGDRRGRQSAAILVVKPKGGYGGFNDRYLDYRVDDDPDPVARLGGLLDLHELYFGSSPETERLEVASAAVLPQLQQLLVRTGYLSGQPSGAYDDATRSAFDRFIGNENFEERCSPASGWIDRPVWEFLTRRFGEQA